MKHMPYQPQVSEPPADGARIRLISQGFNSWKVQVLFTDKSIGADAITHQLQEVKRALARQFGVPDRVLEYANLISKQMTRSGMLVQMLIVKPELPAGKPVFRALPVKGESGILFSDMQIEVDLYPYDEFDQFLTLRTVETRLAERSFDKLCVDWDGVAAAIAEMETTLTPKKKLVIGRGQLPGVGNSSRLTYGIPVDQEHILKSAWMGTRPVVKGEFLVEVSPAAGSFRWGKNVFARELEPVAGLQTKLEAGEGTRLILRATRLLAQRDGLLIFSRVGRDRRDRDAYSLAPARLSGGVLPAEILEASQVAELELDKAAIIRGTLPGKAAIRTTAPLYIEGSVSAGCCIEARHNLRIVGNVQEAVIASSHHLSITGDVNKSDVAARLTLQIDGAATNCQLRAGELICALQQNCSVHAMQETQITPRGDSGGAASVIRLNLRKFLENQQLSGQEALDELRVSLARIVDIFGPEISLNVTEGTAQRMLLKWLRKQKTAGIGNYTHAEVREFRTVLEMIPLIRDQLAAIGMELRDVTAQLCDTPPNSPDE